MSSPAKNSCAGREGAHFRAVELVVLEKTVVSPIVQSNENNGDGQACQQLGRARVTGPVPVQITTIIGRIAI